MKKGNTDQHSLVPGYLLQIRLAELKEFFEARSSLATIIKLERIATYMKPMTPEIRHSIAL